MIVSTVAVSWRRSASFTGMNFPLSESRPILFGPLFDFMLLFLLHEVAFGPICRPERSRMGPNTLQHTPRILSKRNLTHAMSHVSKFIHRQRRNARARCCGVLGFVNPPTQDSDRSNEEIKRLAREAARWMLMTKKEVSELKLAHK